MVSFEACQDQTQLGGEEEGRHIENISVSVKANTIGKKCENISFIKYM